MTTEKKKLNENDDEIRVCEVKCQTHSNDTEILIVLLLLLKVVKWNHRVHLLLDSTNNVKNLELDENHPTLVKQGMRRFSSLKYEQSFPWLYYSCIKSGYFGKYCELFQTDPTNSSILYVNCGVDLGTHPTRKLEYHNESIKHKQSVEKF